MDIGKKIRAAREDLGMPATVLARRVGVGRNTISRYEAGDREPSVSMLEKIARELRIELVDLLREPVPLVQPVGVEELDELLARVGSRTQNLCDPDLIRSLEGASDAAVSRTVRQTRQELELLIPELSRLGDGLEPGDDGYMSFNKALAWASTQVLAFDFFLRARDEVEPEEVAVHALSRELLELAMAG